MASLGLRWCVGCLHWLPMRAVERSRCRDCERAYERQRYASDPEYRAERRQHAHARKRGIKPVPFVGQETLLETFNGRCAYCPNAADTWDHITPISKGGKTEPGNVVPCCAACNSSKKSQDVEAWYGTLARHNLHPAFEDTFFLSNAYLAA